MTRTLCYDLSFAEARAERARLVVRLALNNVAASKRGAHAREMTATIPINTIRPALVWFHAMAGATDAISAELEGGDIIIPLSSAATARWQIAILLNLIDFAVGEPDKDVQLISAVQVHAPGAGNWTHALVLEDLRKRMDVSRANLTERLPKNTFIDEYTLGEWPQDAWYYTFAVTWKLNTPLAPHVMDALYGLLDDLELVVAWMGFALTGDAQGWEDQGKMIFPGETRVGPRLIYWGAERPPSDIAFACLWIDRLIEVELMREVTMWSPDIKPLDG